MFGRPLSRSEDAGLLSGSARFLDDLEVAQNALHLAVLRSPFAHARVELPESASEAGRRLVLPSDIAHLTWDHLLPGPPPRAPLAGDLARYAGQPVAAVIGKDAAQAMDALEHLEVDFEALPAAVELTDALSPDAPLVYEEMGSNIVWHDASSADPGLFDGVDHVITRTFRNPRLAPGMLECRGVVAVPDRGRITVHVGHQNPHKLQGELCSIFGFEADQVRVKVPEVGGAFGAKAPLYPEYVLCVWAALELGQPVKYLERRSENLAVTTHGRGQVQRVRLGAAADGTLRALRVEIDADFGAAADIQRWCVVLTRRMLSGAYRIPRIEWLIRGVLTHTPPVGAFRGAGRPEATYLIERAMDELARELSTDPAELRRRNFIPQEEFPYDTGTGIAYDSGAYGTALDVALKQIGYEKARDSSSGDALRGVGLASYVEMSAGGEEYADVALESSGDVVVLTGTLPHGQGHDTTWSQLVAEQLGLPVDRVRVVHGDTAIVPRGGGTSGSRSAVLGGTAVHLAAIRVANQLRRMAAERLEAAPGDIRLQDGCAFVVGTDIGVDLVELVEDNGAPVAAEEVFAGGAQNFPFGTHACVVEVDVNTGEIQVVDYVEVDDCGRVINPLVVEGQLHGGTLQGISHALFEAVRFDQAGQLLTGNLTTYPLPSIRHAPEVRCMRTETPSPINPMGLKGVGESGVTGATPAIANAVYDALAPLGIGEEDLTMPFTPDRVWTAIRETG